MTQQWPQCGLFWRLSIMRNFTFVLTFAVFFNCLRYPLPMAPGSSILSHLFGLSTANWGATSKVCQYPPPHTHLCACVYNLPIQHARTSVQRPAGPLPWPVRAPENAVQQSLQEIKQTNFFKELRFLLVSHPSLYLDSLFPALCSHSLACCPLFPSPTMQSSGTPTAWSQCASSALVTHSARSCSAPLSCSSSSDCPSCKAGTGCRIICKGCIVMKTPDV